MRMLLTLLLAFPLIGLAQDKKPETKKKAKAADPNRIAIDDPAKLKDNRDFDIQGEYEATQDVQGVTKKVGMNVIANGPETFGLIIFQGGLQGVEGSKRFRTLTGKRVGDVITSTWKNIVPEGNATVQVDKESKLVFDAQKESVKIDDKYELMKVIRKSPTLGAEPPKGAIVLFNKPEDLAKWDGMKTVKLSDGEFLGVGGRTKQKFQSFTLHLEFRLPWMPNSTGQQRGNSGVYLQDRYELQVLDSFGLKGENNECGGFYQIAAPKVNMCFPPMTWQTYDIEFTAAKFEDGRKTKNAVVTVKHNGVVIHDKLELKNNTPGGGITKEVPEPGSLFLQNHSDPVVYRNIWIVEK